MVEEHGVLERRQRSGAVGQTIGALLTLIIATVVWALPSSAAGFSPRDLWSWPTGAPVAVTRPFDPPAMPWLAGHRGVDLNAPIGEAIFAPADGSVIFAGDLAGRGVVSIMHSGGLRSTYEPVTPLVEAGQSVARGDPIATVDPGHYPGSLHWGARYGQNEYVNPLRLLVGPSVLKPWDG